MTCVTMSHETESGSGGVEEWHHPSVVKRNLFCSPESARPETERKEGAGAFTPTCTERTTDFSKTYTHTWIPRDWTRLSQVTFIYKKAFIKWIPQRDQPERTNT